MDTFEAQLEKRVQSEIADGHPYEALQYVQSFIARKKKTLTSENASTLVFLGARLLAAAGAYEETGALLVWFMETGAGEVLRFQLRTNVSQTYCDLDKLLQVMKGLSPANAAPIISKIASAITQLRLSAHTTDVDIGTSLQSNMLKFEDICADAFQVSGNYLNALKSICRLNDMSRAAKLLHDWANRGYKYEYPLFFARAALHMLAEDQSGQAVELVANVKQANYIIDADYADVANDGYPCASLAVWHFCTIVVELVSVTGVSRVNKRAIYNVLCDRYRSIITQLDAKLPALLVTVANTMFDDSDDVGSSSSKGMGMGGNAGMMNMLQNMMGGGGGGGGGFDLKGMMGALQGAGGAGQRIRK